MNSMLDCIEKDEMLRDVLKRVDAARSAISKFYGAPAGRMREHPLLTRAQFALADALCMLAIVVDSQHRADVANIDQDGKHEKALEEYIASLEQES